MSDSQARLLQLQFWSPEKRAYIPASSFEQADTDAGRELADIGRNTANGRGWRVAGLMRPLKPSYRAPRPTSTRPVAEVQREYLEWAQSEGLKSIHVYSDNNKGLANYTEIRDYRYGRKIGTHRGPPIFTGTMVQMTLEEHFAVLESVVEEIVPA
jgi:hypothetical protein